MILPGGQTARTRAEKAPDSNAYLLSVVDFKKKGRFSTFVPLSIRPSVRKSIFGLVLSNTVNLRRTPNFFLQILKAL